MPLSALAAFVALAQSGPIELREGLAIRNVVRAGRTPIVIDGVLADFAKRTSLSPQEGQEIVMASGDKRSWEALKAGEDGTFSGNAFQGGYAYFRVDRPLEEIRVLESAGWGMVYVDGNPRAGDPYGYGYVKLPVRLRKGKTGFLFASGRGRPWAKLSVPPASAFFNLGDTTLPDLVEGESGSLWAGIIVLNATDSWMRDLRVRARIGEEEQAETAIPAIPPLSFRKVPVRLEASGKATGPDIPLTLSLLSPEKLLDYQKSSLRIRTPKQTRKVTFISKIDGSVQYYAVNPAQTPGDGKALVLTLHGASVEAIGQADAYQGKDWCHIVAATNRRPYGFDWEDVGRLDALEVLEHARATLKTDPLQMYLAGHSMGGHGTWINGYLFPDKWAAIAPAAGWISFFGYGGGQRIRGEGDIAEALSAASNASDTLLWIRNSLNYPIFIHHGDKDDNVPVSQAREMKAELDKLPHPNVTLHEVPGAGHWFGNESVDWPGIFDLFKSVKLKTPAEKAEVDFSTANLAASSKAWWVEILQQEKPMQPSRVQLKRTSARVTGSTENVEALRLDPAAFEPGTNPRIIEIDGQTISISNALEPGPAVILKKVQDTWTASTDRLESQKRPEQMGPFKEVFKNNFCYVYGTKGSAQETNANLRKAIFDAEVFTYRGNGSVSIYSDDEFLRILAEEATRVYIRKPDVRNVILVGNVDTNGAWGVLLKRCPIEVRRGGATFGEKRFKGSDLACLFVRPRAGDDRALVGVMASTGEAGSRVLERLPYFTSGAHFPDWILYSSEMLLQGMPGVRAAGFFRNDWGLSRVR